MSLADELPQNILTPGVMINYSAHEEIARQTEVFLRKNKITIVDSCVSAENKPDTKFDRNIRIAPVCEHNNKKLPPTLPKNAAGK